MRAENHEQTINCTWPYRELMLFWGMGLEFKDKMMLHCFREVKGKQGFSTGI